MLKHSVIHLPLNIVEASRGAGAQVSDCKRDRFWAWFSFEEIKYFIKFIFLFVCLVSRQSAALSSSNRMPPEFGGNGERNVLTKGFPLRMLQRCTYGGAAVLVAEVVEQREGAARHAVAVRPLARRLRARRRRAARAVRARRVREHLRRRPERPAMYIL